MKFSGKKIPRKFHSIFSHYVIILYKQSKRIFHMKNFTKLLVLALPIQNIVQTNDAIANYRENLYTPSFLIQQLDFDNN